MSSWVFSLVCGCLAATDESQLQKGTGVHVDAKSKYIEFRALLNEEALKVSIMKP